MCIFCFYLKFKSHCYMYKKVDSQLNWFEETFQKIFELQYLLGMSLFFTISQENNLLWNNITQVHYSANILSVSCTSPYKASSALVAFSVLMKCSSFYFFVARWENSWARLIVIKAKAEHLWNGSTEVDLHYVLCLWKPEAAHYMNMVSNLTFLWM